jgi:phospholipid/cholesterol/gamma-HCH transport system ATP-binding protein
MSRRLRRVVMRGSYHRTKAGRNFHQRSPGLLPRIRHAKLRAEMPAIHDQPGEPDAAAIVFEKVSLAFDDNVVLRDVSFSVRPASTLFLLGASGSGKSVVLKLILGLLKPDSGVIRVRGERVDNMSEQELLRVRGDIGMLFQETALFDSLTVADNVGYRLLEEMGMPYDDVRRRSQEVLGFIGLAEYMDRMPSELSGGQRRRVAIARAFASKPRHLLIDDPTSGLDPITSKTVDNEIIKFRDLEHVTSVVVTHQLPDAFYIASHEATPQNGGVTIVPADPGKADEAEFIMLADAQIYFEGNFAALRASTDPYLKKFLSD